MVSCSNRISFNFSTFNELSIEDKEKIPADVFTQLSKDFLPAAKEIAHVGSELLQNYQSLQKSFNQYMQAIDTLIRSSKKAFPKAKAHGDDLRELAAKSIQILERHKKCIRELSSLVTKTNAYSNEEKDKLKCMLSKFQRDKKKIRKQCSKGLKSTSELESFIETSANEFIHQQELRYKFFLEKHKIWLFTYSDLISNDLVKELNEGKTGTGEILRAYEMKGEGVISETGISLTAPVDSSIWMSRSDQIERDSTRSLSSIENSRRNSTTKQQEVVGTVTAKSGSLSFNEESAQVNQRRVDSFVRVAAVSEKSSCESSPLIQNQTNEFRAITDYKETASDWRNYMKYLPHHTVKPPVDDHYSSNTVLDLIDYRPVEPETKLNNGKRPPVGGRWVLPPLQNFRPHNHVDAMYAPETIPADRPQPPKIQAQNGNEVPPLFNNSDYGRTLTVKEQFNGTSGQQITVKPGNKVVLIKNGSRGWIFVKDTDSQRTGWIPALFVNN